VWLAELFLRGPGVEEPPRLLYFTEPGVEPQHFDLAPPTDWQVFQLLPQPVGNTLWFIGNRGFLSYNPAIDQWGVFEIIADLFPMVRAFRQAGEIVWFITENDLGQFNTTTGSHTLTPLPVTSTSSAALAVTPDEVWLLLDGILFRGRPESAEWTQIESGAPCLAEAEQLTVWAGSLWVGGSYGVGRLDPAGEKWKCYSPATGMLDQEFAQLLPAQEELWFAHPWYGIWRYREP
jgi:streptogramin lyase